MLSGDIRRAAVYSFKHGVIGTDIAGWNESETADQTAAEVGEDVSLQVLHDHHVKLVRVHHELHAGVVDDLVIALDLRIFFRDLLENG